MQIAAQSPLTDALQPMEAAAFVEARHERAVRVAYRMLAGDAEAAEGVAQNAILRAYRALPGFRGESSVDTRFYRILVREVPRHRRPAETPDQERSEARSQDRTKKSGFRPGVPATGAR